jgi:hypothetical protein
MNRRLRRSGRVGLTVSARVRVNDRWTTVTRRIVLRNR